MRNRAERRHLTQAIIARRKKLMKDHGQQGGLIYEKHRDKVNRSVGYMRDGNVTHYVDVGFHQKTRNRKRYSAIRILSKRDEVCEETQKQQVEEVL